MSSDCAILRPDQRFSLTASPNTGGSADWCKYNIGYDNVPDTPKLGDTKDFLLIGADVYTSSAYVRSDVNWVAKPGPGTACLDSSTLASGTVAGLKDKNGDPAFSPVPANQTDTSGAGWVVARAWSLPSTFLSVGLYNFWSCTRLKVVQAKPSG